MTALKANGRRHTVDVDPGTPLLWVLRDSLDLAGAKYGCGTDTQQANTRSTDQHTSLITDG